MFADQIFQPIYRFRFGNIEFHRGFADVEIHLARRAADISKVRIRHFTWAVHDATHDGNLYAFEMQCCCFDFIRSTSYAEMLRPGSGAIRYGNDAIVWQILQALCGTISLELLPKRRNATRTVS
jgi:hypothetical protein